MRFHSLEKVFSAHMKIINIGRMDKISLPAMFASKGAHLGTEAHMP
jgi:hypothetical protein